MQVYGLVSFYGAVEDRLAPVGVVIAQAGRGDGGGAQVAGGKDVGEP